MPTLQNQIAEKFLERLAATAEFDDQKIEQLRVLISGGKKLKPDDLVKIFSLPAGGDIS